MSMTEKIKIVLVKERTLLLTWLHYSAALQPIYIIKRDNFSEKELIDIGNALDCDFVEQFKIRGTADFSIVRHQHSYYATQSLTLANI